MLNPRVLSNSTVSFGQDDALAIYLVPNGTLKSIFVIKNSIILILEILWIQKIGISDIRK